MPVLQGNGMYIPFDSFVGETIKTANTHSFAYRGATNSSIPPFLTSFVVDCPTLERGRHVVCPMDWSLLLLPDALAHPSRPLVFRACLFPRSSIRKVGFHAFFPSTSSPSTTLHVLGCVPRVHIQLRRVSCHNHVGGIHGGVGSRGT